MNSSGFLQRELIQWEELAEVVILVIKRTFKILNVNLELIQELPILVCNSKKKFLDIAHVYKLYILGFRF